MQRAAPEAASSRLASRARGRRGFTLLEVLAAVMILAIWYIVIANAAVRGLGREGESLRLMEAALLADNVLAEIEATTIDGTAPEHMQDSRKEDPYTVEIHVGGFGGGGLGAFAPPSPAEEDPDAPPPDLPGLIGKEMPGLSQHLRTITVKVAWQETGREREVVRTTYAFDVAKAVEALYPEGEETEDYAATDETGAEEDDARPGQRAKEEQ